MFIIHTNTWTVELSVRLIYNLGAKHVPFKKWCFLLLHYSYSVTTNKHNRSNIMEVVLVRYDVENALSCHYTVIMTTQEVFRCRFWFPTVFLVKCIVYYNRTLHGYVFLYIFVRGVHPIYVVILRPWRNHCSALSTHHPTSQLLLQKSFFQAHLNYKVEIFFVSNNICMILTRNPLVHGV